MKAKIIICSLLISLISFLACEGKYSRINDEYAPELDNAALAYLGKHARIYDGYASELDNTSLAYEDRYIIIDDGFTPAVGKAADGGHLMIRIFFSLECKTEDKWGSDLIRAEVAKGLISEALCEYVSKIFYPKHTWEHLVEILSDEENTLFSDGFAEYIKDNSSLRNYRNVKVTSIKFM